MEESQRDHITYAALWTIKVSASNLFLRVLSSCHCHTRTRDEGSSQKSRYSGFYVNISRALICGNSVSISGVSMLHRSFLPSSIMGLLETSYQILAALFFGFILFKQLKIPRRGNPKGLPLPPGPKGYPLIGSLFDMPINKPWLVYDKWSKTYGKSMIIVSIPFQRLSLFIGDMIYFKVLGLHFLILSSIERTTDLLEKRSSNYSDRMRLPMLLELYVSDSLHLSLVIRKLVSE